MQILSGNNIDRAEWNALVKASATGTWFQSPEAYSFYQSLPDLLRPFAVAAYSQPLPKGKGELRGVCVGYVTRDCNALRQVFTRRAIINGGPVLANDATPEEVEALMSAVRKALMNEPLSLNDRPIYIETRNFHDYSEWKGAFRQAGFEYRLHLNFHIDCRDKEAMWERLSERRRREITRAGKSGVTVEEAASEQDIAEWYSILHELYRMKVKTPLFPAELFLAFYRSRAGKYLLVKQGGTIIGGIMCPILDGRCIYEWYICGLDKEYRDQSPSVMATWAAMEYANAHGLPMFDIMGAGEPGVPYGVRDFKAEFGGELVEHGRYLCITKPLLYRIGVLGVKIMKRK